MFFSRAARLLAEIFVGFQALKIFSLGQKSQANAAGTTDPKNIELQPPWGSIA
jgi:hypothetical protein